jgi:hypothetical protein
MLTQKSRAIILAGLLAGTLDGLAAALLFIIRTGKNPLAVFRFIASGVFGQEALSGGVFMAAIGIFFHYVIAAGWSFIFFIACSRLVILWKYWVVSGIGYGLLVWLMMNLVVLPLSRVPSVSMTVNGVLIGISVLIVCIGLPISFSSKRYFQQENQL